MQLKVYIRTTERCNLKCKHCYVGESLYKKDFNDQQTIIWLKQYLNFHNIEEKNILISFHGGEPFLCDLNKIHNILNSFPQSSFDATTNLTFSLSNDVIKLIKKFIFNKKPFIKISWDAGTIRFNENTLSLWENNIKVLQENEINFKTNVCLTNELLKIQPIELVSYFDKIGVKEVHFERLSENTTVNKLLIPKYDDVDNWLLELYNLKSGIFIDNILDIKTALKGYYIGCRSRECMKNTLTINANGSIGGCPNTSLTDPYTSIFEPIKNIYEKHILLCHKEQLKNAKCYFCDLFKVCNGDCFQLSWQGDTCPAPKRLIYHIKDELSKVDNSWRNKRKLSYLINEFDDYNLPYTEVEFNPDLVVEFFNTESKLIYPAKSYFVAIVYAKLLEKYFNVDFYDALDFNDLLFDDKFFMPYSFDKGSYDYILSKIPNNFLDLPSTKKTESYFKQEFLLK